VLASYNDRNGIAVAMPLTFEKHDANHLILVELSAAASGSRFMSGELDFGRGGCDKRSTCPAPTPSRPPRTKNHNGRRQISSDGMESVLMPDERQRTAGRPTATMALPKQIGQ
jgi:hypothetical protein